CLLSVECRVEHAWDSGDHRTVIGRVLHRRVREPRAGQEPLRFGGSVSKNRRLVKWFLCQTGLMDALETARSFNKSLRGIESGTRQQVHARPVAGRRIAPAPPGICLVGCGWWGAVHALELKGLGSRIRRFFASRELDKARSFARRFDGEDTFAGIDAAL